MALNENERDAHIKAIYYILLPFVVLTIVSLFVSIFTWNSMDGHREVEAITWSLTVIEIVLALFAIMLGIVAIFGFWAIRGAAVASAKREARAYLDEKAAQMFQQVAKTQQLDGSVEKPDIPEGVDETDVISKAQEEQSDDGQAGK
ncbi:hypothetical protein AAFO92_15890 [Roseovarius sp. CAU 1744]|uniref:hypothetical protein n=1 Tax=Roseovarius sp. CAU 1744 TaxID=3140368 RepID=UPI00325BED29